MSATKHGGPVLPVYWPTARSEGATLRDYFMAHAPAKPQDWFRPEMPAAPRDPMPKPQDLTPAESEELAAWGDVIDAKDMKEPRVRAYAEDVERQREEQRAWNIEREKQRYIQWPRAWADAMLEEREKGGAQ